MLHDRAGYLNYYNTISNCINNVRLLKKELHYVESYADTFNQECNMYNNNSCYNTFDCGCCLGYGFSGGNYTNGCGFPCYNSRFCKRKIKRNKKIDDKPCNPFCKPCYKLKCYDPSDKFEKCQCKACIKSLITIYGCGC